MQVNIAENKSWIYWLPLIVLGVIYTLCFYYYPYLNDDLEFRAPMSEYIAHPSWAAFIEGWRESVDFRFHVDNGRLPQLIGSVMVVLPKLFMALVMSIFLVLSIYLTAKCAGVWKRNIALTALCVLCWVLAFPWADYMFGIMFYMNYVPVSTILLISYYLLINNKLTHIVPAFLLGILLGCMHEIFAGTMFCGVLSLLVFYQQYRRRANISFFIGLIAGILYLIFTPGTANRQNGADMFVGFEYPMRSFVYGGLFYVYVIVTVVCLSMRSWKAKINMPMLTMQCVMALCAWLLWRTFLTGLRVSWCMNVVSTVGIVYMLSRYPIKFAVSERLCVTSAILLFGISFVTISVCLPWFKRLGEDVDAARNLLSKSNGDAVFYDIVEPSDAPVYLLGKPNLNAWKLWSADLETVLPQSAKTFRPTEALNIGNGIDAYRCGHSVVLPFDRGLVNNYFDVKFKLGEEPVSTGAIFIPFRNEYGDSLLFTKLYFIPLHKCNRPISCFRIL